MTFLTLEAGPEVATFRGAWSHDFATSFANGMYSPIAGLAIAAIVGIRRTLYFPGLPVVLSTCNVVCIVRRAGAAG